VRFLWFLKLIFLNFILLFVSLHAHAATIVDLNSINNNLASPVFVQLEAGTYQISTIGISGGGLFDAWLPWSTATCTDANGCPRIYPTLPDRMGWLNTYQVSSPYISEVSVDRKPVVARAIEPPDDEPIFENYFIKSTEKTYFRVEDGFCYPIALDALRNAQTAVFTLSQRGKVGFSFWDTNIIDNQGGISLRISSVPVPAAAWLLGTGLIGLVGLRRKFKC
jgi:hypothetical protein